MFSAPLPHKQRVPRTTRSPQSCRSALMKLPFLKRYFQPVFLNITHKGPLQTTSLPPRLCLYALNSVRKPSPYFSSVLSKFPYLVLSAIPAPSPAFPCPALGPAVSLPYPCRVPAVPFPCSTPRGFSPHPLCTHKCPLHFATCKPQSTPWTPPGFCPPAPGPPRHAVRSAGQSEPAVI